MHGEPQRKECMAFGAALMCGGRRAGWPDDRKRGELREAEKALLHHVW